MPYDIWGISESAQYTPGTSLTGYRVEATDGHIGKVDEATYEVGSACIVVNCKPWLVGRHVLLPAGTISRIDHGDETVHVDRTKDQIKAAPEYDPAVRTGDAGYRAALGSYYGAQRS